MPFHSLLTVCNIVALTIIFLIIFPTSLSIPKFLLFCSLMASLTILRCFDKITITDHRIVLRTMLVNRTVLLDDLLASPYLTVHPYIFKKYEWQRKLLRQNYQKIYQDKACIYFSFDQQLKTTTLLHKPINYLGLGLFSKKQRQEILAILSRTWRLDPTLQPPKDV